MGRLHVDRVTTHPRRAAPSGGVSVKSRTKSRLLCSGMALCFALSMLVATCARVTAADAYPRRFNKTYAQILAMGRTAWMEYQGGKAGHSTADMSEGLAAYRAALKWRNDRLSASSPGSVRRAVAALRPLMTGYADAMMEIGAYLSGGGTIWSNIHAGVLADAELALFGVLEPNSARATPHTTGEVDRALSALAARISARRREPGMGKSGYADAAVQLAAARRSWARIRPQAASLDRRGSDHVLHYCIRTSASAAEGMSE